MPDYTGGLRDRLISTSFEELVRSILDDLGWLTPNPDERANVEFRVEPLLADEYEKIKPNLVVVTVETIDPDEEQEMGGPLTEDTHLAFIDIFAEADYIGKHIAGDLRTALEGQMSSIGRVMPALDVVDYSTGTATPETLFTCELLNINQDRSHRPTEQWERNYFAVALEIVDGRD